KTIGQQPGGGLPVSLNETGVQTDSSDRTGYSGTEVSATGAGGVVGRFATEAFQADWYVRMLDLVACDPNVAVVNIFHLVDEASLAGWQTGLYFADHTAKRSAAAVRDWISRTGGACSGKATPWTPGKAVASTAAGATPLAKPHVKTKTKKPKAKKPKVKAKK